MNQLRKNKEPYEKLWEQLYVVKKVGGILEIPVFKGLSGDIDILGEEMVKALEDVHNFKLGKIDKSMECVQNETKLPYWTAVFKLSHFKTWTHFKHKDAKEIGVEVADDLKVFWNQRGKNINSKLKDQITFEQFCANYQEFLAHVIKNFGNRFDTYEYLDFWALMISMRKYEQNFVLPGYLW